ncbi:putative pre-mRNA-splicing factor ATP-dependent RNA helicase DEAH6 [Bienertia sinuspersici]
MQLKLTVMGTEANLKSWVSDKLMSLLGYSQPTVVQYVIGLTKHASSPGDVVGKLVEFGLSTSKETRDFAEEIYARVPRKNSAVNLYQKQEKEAAMLVRKQRTYQLLDADDEDDDMPVAENKSSASVASESKKLDSRKKRFRRKSDNLDEHDDDDEA